MVLRSPSRRDAVLILLGALCTHLLSVLAPLAPHAIVISHSVQKPLILDRPLLHGQAPGDSVGADVLIDEFDPVQTPDNPVWDLSGEKFPPQIVLSC